MRTFGISIVAGAALASAMAVPASAIPMSNLAAAVSNLAPGESVRYVRKLLVPRQLSRLSNPSNQD